MNQRPLEPHSSRKRLFYWIFCGPFSNALVIEFNFLKRIRYGPQIRNFDILVITQHFTGRVADQFQFILIGASCTFQQCAERMPAGMRRVFMPEPPACNFHHRVCNADSFQGRVKCFFSELFQIPRPAVSIREERGVRTAGSRQNLRQERLDGEMVTVRPLPASVFAPPTRQLRAAS